MKTFLVFIVFMTLQPFSLFAKNIATLQYQDIKVTHTYQGKSKEVVIRRHQDPKCLDLAINHETVFSQDMANKNVPQACKKTFITTLGSIQPIKISNVQTIAELEVLDFIKKSIKEPEKYVLVDSRKEDWFENSTIPTSVNIPYNTIAYDEDFPEDFQKLLNTLNIKKLANDKFDFSKAKTAILFCNGSWCVQSKRAIKELIKMAYPKEKLMWYRSGLQDWNILGFTTIRGDLK
ncbi:rhodanese-like domain-containing protein [Sulfurimonas sp.]|uniref:rhodanese-like domain-containing protein n=1 Tax=Sulfurimonas sp. TaxID=2022749 RepID=UPI0025E61953|nr:rhodanese-like domain-containing protein [Sulfurimonas sp.]